ncbi:tigger transposable element-derived protein 6 [Rhipicephalus sanguineus]|uniref:tigger transposable element-derived protein 6 n=1 Tax=Rhipicephalus sanguineus TaxID=34632 RepID=UPI001893C341|nr:tigger transposable element-derived protein 6 [Rhipicephalus sanguineus]
MAKQFPYILHETDFEPGGSWIQQFKGRHKIVYKAITGEAASLDMEAKRRGKSHAVKGDPCKGGRNSKLPVFWCSNMDGSDKCLAFVIAKSNPRCKNPGAVPPQWESVDDVGTVSKVVERAHRAANRTVALALDNCSAHHSMPADTTSEGVFFLPPNTTAGLQPMDIGVIVNFKLLYRRRVLERFLPNVGNAAQGGQEPDLKITLLMAVQFIFRAWCGVRASMARKTVSDVEMSECLSDEAIVAHIHAAASGESDDSDDTVEQPTQVLSSQEAQQVTQSLRDFVFAKDLPLSYMEHLDALEKDVRHKLTDYGFSANKYILVALPYCMQIKF